MDINGFKAHLRGGELASPSKFRVLFSGGVLKNSSARAIAYMCNQASLPGRSIATNDDFRTYGPIRKIPYDDVYDDLVLGIYCTEDMDPKRTFDDWMTAICDNVTGNFNYYDNYATNIDIEQLDGNGKVVYTARCEEAYPTMIAPLSLDHSTTDSFHNLSVTFAYRRWKEYPVPLNPFGSNIRINSLYPNLDLGGALDRFGVAVVGRAEGQIMSRIEHGLTFAGALSSAASSDRTKTTSLDNYFIR